MSTLSALLQRHLRDLRRYPRWSYVTPRFTGFLRNIEPTDRQREDVIIKARGIIECLDRHFWGHVVVIPNTTGIVVGSWAKKTRTRPSSDLDMIYLLPLAVYYRFLHRSGNRQSGILQEVKRALETSYPATEIKCDGPTVIMNFSTYKIEIAPAFLNLQDMREINHPQFQVLLCDTNSGGRYKSVAPTAEVNKVLRSNKASNGDLIALIRMAKTWRRHCNVPIKSFFLEQLAIDFMAQWSYAGFGPFWYDWMVRDFFAFLITKRNTLGILPVTFEVLFYGDEWSSRAETALKNATAACKYEEFDLGTLAGEEWQKIFGPFIPKEV